MSTESNQIIDDCYLPDLCQTHSVFVVVVVAECLAIILSLGKLESMLGFWIDLSLVSLFVQWVALVNVMFLCYLRKHIKHHSVLRTSLSAFVIIQLVTLVFSWLTLWVLAMPDSGVDYGVDDPVKFVVRNLIVSSIFSVLALRYFYIQYLWRLQTREEARSRFRALQARIRPHFLFNSLNTIAALITIKPKHAEEAVLDLSEVFRATLESQERIPLRDEIALIKKHLSIEGLRLGERLKVEWSLPDDLPLDEKIPALLIQPLVENTVYHGVQLLPEGGTVTIAISNDAQYWAVTVGNPRPSPTSNSDQPGNGFAQHSIRQRLQLIYGDRAEFSVDASDDRYCVIMRWPMEEEA